MCLNRENRRALKKKLRDKGSRTLAADVLESLGNEIDKKIRDGDLVILNVDQIIARKDYPRMQGEYRQFVESSRNKVFADQLQNAVYRTAWYLHSSEAGYIR